MCAYIHIMLTGQSTDHIDTAIADRAFKPIKKIYLIHSADEKKATGHKKTPTLFKNIALDCKKRIEKNSTFTGKVKLFQIDNAFDAVPTILAIKRIFDDDKGPNTGGMGAYSPAPVVTDEIHQRIMNEVINPTVEGMAKEGHPYTGFLYAGLMITADGTPKVIEYNCRFGDPETQPMMLRLKSDLVELIEAANREELDKTAIEFDPRAAVGVVLAAKGYPDSYPKGDAISGLQVTYPEGEKVFHAGTKQDGDNVVTAGGRVLCATALGNTVTEAQQRAYKLVDQISWEGMEYRTDIAYRAIAREQN